VVEYVVISVVASRFMKAFDNMYTDAYTLYAMRTQERFSQKQLEALKHIRDWLVRQGRPPSVRELMAALGYKSPKSAQDILEQLRAKGAIRKLSSGECQLIGDPGVEAQRAQTVSVPLVGVAACGGPMLAEENIEGYIAVSTAIAKPGRKYFLLRARGDSMDKAGIRDGDMVLVRQQPTADQGDRVVALIDQDATIKEYQRANDMVVLRPRSSNPRHKPILLTKDFRVQGIVETVVPNLE
jgi:repressor LexA